MIEPVTRLDDIVAALSEDALYERALYDCITALMRRATLNRSLRDATVQLDLWRQKFEERARP